MNRSTSEAIVVRLVDYGEADRIATLLSRAEGKVAALARGARRSRRRYPGLELFTVGEARLREGRGELWTLDGFDVARGFPRLCDDVARLAQAAYGCELVRELLPPHQAEPVAFDLLRELLEHLDAGRAEGARGPAFLRVFELALLAVIGLPPTLDRCAVCGQPPLPGSNDAAASDELDAAAHAFDLRRGGLLCLGDGAAHGPGRRPMAAATLDLLRCAQRLPLAEAPALLVPPRSRAAWEQARAIVQALLVQHLGRPLRSVEFIAKLNAAGA